MSKKQKSAVSTYTILFYALLAVNFFALIKTESQYNTSIFIAALMWTMFGAVFYIIIDEFLLRRIYTAILKLDRKLSKSSFSIATSEHSREIDIIWDDIMSLDLISSYLMQFMTIALPVILTLIGLTFNYSTIYNLTEEEGLIYLYGSLGLMIIAFIGTYLYLSRSQKYKRVLISIEKLKTLIRSFDKQSV